MTKKTMMYAALIGGLLGAAGLGFAQRSGLGGFGGAGIGGGGVGGVGGGRGGRGGGGGFGRGTNTPPKADLTANRDGTPIWPVDPHFKHDVFTFVRVRYFQSTNPYLDDGTLKSGGNWLTDFPGSDLHFPFRLQQLTSMKVAPDTLQLDITEDALFDYPFLYMLEVGRLEFTEEQMVILRRHLLNGGFLLIDDHWGLNEQKNWAQQLHRLFPDRKPVELDISHPIFHCVFDLKEIPQVPGVNNWLRYHTTYEREDDPKPHYRATYDDKGRIMVLEAANTDLGDGWEEEGTNEEYFHKFSEKQAYPMGVNIIFYAMTH